MIKFTLKVLFLFGALTGYSQVNITNVNTPYQQDFNSLSPVSTTNSYSTLPTGWVAKEIGSNANQEYRADNGSLAGGDLYSYGASVGIDSTERAFGSLGSGSLTAVHYGVRLINSTTTTITSITVSYTGELWRVGNAQRSTFQDSLHFFYAVNADSINQSGFIAVSNLNFVSPAGPTDPRNQVAVDGNDAAQQTSISYTFNVTIAPGDTLWLKWFDFNSASYDDGLAIDDLSVSFQSAPPVISSLYGQIAAFDTYYTEDFNSLGNTYGTTYNFTSLPQAWFIKEGGGNADQTYRASFGDYAGGNTYSYGDSLSNERALGSLGSGSLTPVYIGSAWINTTGQVINNIEINYTGEMWRQGRPLRATGPDTLHFSYAVNATDIESGSYVDYTLLNFFSPVENGTLNIPVDGNNATYRTQNSAVIGNLSIQPGDTVWVRWMDVNSDSYDDGLAIDDFSIAAVTTATLLTVEFPESTTYIHEEEEVVAIPVVISNPNNFLSQVEVSLESAGTIDLNSDVNLVSSVVSFPAGMSQDTAYFFFTVLNSEPFENEEYFVLKLSNPSNAFLGTTIYDTVRIINYDYPLTAITDLKGVNTDGIADSLNKSVAVTGIVHGINFNYTNGLDFYILENGSGIDVYSATTDLSYSVQEGDLVKVWGKVGQFKGLTRLEDLDSIAVLSSGNGLEIPETVATVSEAEESAYLQLNALKLHPAIAQWPNNMEVYAVNTLTNDTLTIFVSSNLSLAGQAAPTGLFNLVGLGSQKSDSINGPYNDGYRVMMLSIENLGTAGVEQLTESNSYKVYPNPSTGILTVSGDFLDAEIRVMTVSGECVAAKTINNGSAEMDLSHLNKGVYFIQITKNGLTETKKWIRL